MLLVFQALQVPSWNISSFLKLEARKFNFPKYKYFSECFFSRLESSFLKYKKFFRRFHFPKYKKSFFWENTRIFLILGIESSIYQNIRNFLILDLESSIPWNFWRWIFFSFLIFYFLFIYFFELGLKSGLGSPIKL